MTALLLLLLVCASCGSEGSEPPPVSSPVGWPESLTDFTVTWTAEHDIDVTSGASVVVRAYLESYYLAELADDEKYLYPGFAQAVGKNQADGPDGTEKLWPELDGPDTWVGTFRHHLLRVDTSDRDVAVIGCLYTYDSGVMVGTNLKANMEPGPYGGINAFRIGLLAPENDGPPLPPQQGPSRAPFTNVFGGWKVTNHQGGFLATAEWPNHAEDNEQCLRLSGLTPENRKFYPGTTYQRSDFPVLPATPGWPAKPDAPTDQPG
ncbi:hypothetical protein [Mycolicibacterium smegmatis]|uniref:hypothetical protein n=1 Tax=Mycolicibacterium smegmatis TaxID=1772 RepID=UPI001E341A8E|nr:hypothetical protein [Mycolicibacterium smegmatis]